MTKEKEKEILVDWDVAEEMNATEEEMEAIIRSPLRYVTRETITLYRNTAEDRADIKEAFKRARYRKLTECSDADLTDLADEELENIRKEKSH